MKTALLICLVLVCCLNVLGQTGRVTGTVMDAETRAPLELATVTAFGQDSSVIAYQLSDKNGMFSLEKLPLARKLIVRFSYAGYRTHTDTVQLTARRTDTLSIYLEHNSGDSLGVIVTAAVPVRMNGDTLEINPAAFKLKNDAVVEELLNQVAGITIWSDGSITVNGKPVQSVLVDGKPFMGSRDTRVATQNLPKSAIDKIQLYQEYDRSLIGQEAQPQDSLLTMNIQLKENSKKGYFGKAGAGYGTRDRFESDLSFQVYTKKSSAGMGGGFNNINKNIGNLEEMFRNNTYRNFNPNLYNTGRFGSSGINRNHSLGVVLTHSFIEEANSRQNNRANVTYTKSGTNNYLSDLSLQNRTTIGNPQFIRDAGEQNSRSDRHDISAEYVKTNSYNDNLSISGAVNSSHDRSQSLRFTEVRDSSNQLQNTNSSSTSQTRKSDNESLNLRFARSDSEDPAKGFSLQLSVRAGNAESERFVSSRFISLTDNTKNLSINRHYDNSSENFSVGGTLDYTGFKRMLLRRYNLFGINLQFTQGFTYSRSSDQSEVSDHDSSTGLYSVNAGLSNRNKRELLEYSPALSLSKSFFKNSEKGYRSFNIQGRLINDIKSDKNFSSVDKRNLERSFRFLRYEGTLSYQSQKRMKYRYFTALNYNKNFEYPNIDYLYTIVDNINVYNIRIGNPALANSTTHALTLNGNFNTENPKSPYSVNGNLNGGYTLTVDPVTDSILNDFSGKRTYYFINAGNSRSRNLNYNIAVARKIRKSSIQLTYNANYRNSRQPNYIDGILNNSTTLSSSQQLGLQFSLNTLLVVNLNQGFQQYQNLPSAAGLNAFTNSSRSSRLGIVLNYPANFSFSGTIDRMANSNVKKPVLLLNTFLAYRFMKQQGELKFSAMDLLKQYQNITNSANAYGTVTRITNGLQQYFLLTFSYYPRKFGKTEIKRQSGNRGR